MEARQVGRSGLRVSRLALGTMSWGAGVESYDAQEQLELFTEYGGSLLDVAPIYGDGNCEPLVGDLLAKTGLRDRVVLAGKAGFVHRDGQVVRDGSRGNLLDQLDQSLRDLRTDHLDLWQIHSPDLTVPLEETFGALEHAVASGRTRYVGVSNFTGWQVGLGHTWLGLRSSPVPLVSNQVEYSMLNRDPEAEVTEAAEHLGMSTLAWSPLGRGVLTGKYRGGRTPGDSRGADSRWDGFVAPYLTPSHGAIVEALARAADGLGVSLSQAALAWLLRRPSVASVIVGARTIDQLAENLEADEVEIPDEINDALTEVSAP